LAGSDLVLTRTTIRIGAQRGLFNNLGSAS